MTDVIKSAELKDLSPINHLMRLSKGYWGYDDAFLNQFINKLGVTEEYLRRNITKLFYKDEKFIGFYSFVKEKDNTLVLDNFFLHPDYIKKGLGRELWRLSCDTARDLGHDEFILFSDPNAESFYLKLGCFKIGEIPSPMVSNRVNPILKYKLKTLALFHGIENFETDRMVAKRITEGDFEDLFHMHQDEQAMATLGGVRSAKETRENLEWNIKQWENNGFGLWLFRSKTTGKLIGRGGIRLQIGDAEKIELGFALMPEYWGQGLATEMAKACIEVAFEKLKLDSLVFFTLTTNLSSQGVIEKTGFKFEKDIELGGEPHVLYRLTADDYWKGYKPCFPSIDFDASLIQAMKASNVPGAAMLIIHDGQIQSAKEYGLADPHTNRVVTPDTLFTIASISKTVTATALMTLYEHGKFALDEDINKYLPFKIYNPNFPDVAITFRMLLSHTSTIQDSEVFFNHYTLHQTPVLPDSPILLGDFLKDYLSIDGRLYNSEDNFIKEVPGTKYQYSNTSFGLVGYLTERISGIQFEEYCKKVIFDPLGMKNTAWHFKDVDLGLMAIPYGYDNSLHQPICYGFYGYPTFPDGALKTSVNEFARFLSVFINEGKTLEGRVLLRSETVKEMLTLHGFSGMDSGETVGLAWHCHNGVYYHDGGDPGISTLAYFNPITGQGKIFFSNGDFDVLSVHGLGVNRS